MSCCVQPEPGLTSIIRASPTLQFIQGQCTRTCQNFTCCWTNDKSNVCLVRPHETAPAITFHAHGWPGVRVRDILKDTVVIDSPKNPVFATHGWRSTVVNLQWPGYDPQTVGKPMLVRIPLQPDGNHLTRQEFAREICALLLDFHKRISRHSIDPRWEEWALATGPEGIRLTDVVLLSVHYYRNVWVPEFYVIE